MGTATPPSRVKLFIAFLFNPKVPYHPVVEQLDKAFGLQEYSLGPVDFTWTEYYSAEMGQELKKVYFSYKKSIDRDMLPTIKQFTNTIEQDTADSSGNRCINIDPGYVCRDKVVLATTKDFYHRLYLANGIYGEVTLHYRRGRFRYFSWTYPDYRAPDVIHFLDRIRAPLVKQLRDGQSID